jgi:DNA polymerase-3 subunit delta
VQIRANELEAQLTRRLLPVYVIHGDEPLIAMEAADAVRAAARRSGYTEREVLEPGRGYDWSEFTHAMGSLSLFAAKKIVELRLASGKPGPQGASAIAAYCERPDPEQLLLVTLPRLDRASRAPRAPRAAREPRSARVPRRARRRQSAGGTPGAAEARAARAAG